MENEVKKIKVFLMFAGLLSFSTVQAATYTATGSSTTYTEVNAGSSDEYKTYTTTNIGTGLRADSLIASADTGNSGNGGGYSETNFLNDVLGTSGSWDETAAGMTFQDGDGKVTEAAAGVYKLNLNTLLVDEDGNTVVGGYFMLKFGGGNTGGLDTTWIFKNEPLMEELIWLAGIQGNVSLGRLSHMQLCVSGCTSGGGTGSGTFETPIPAAIWLFGSALFGLMGVSRKQKTMVA